MGTGCSLGQIAQRQSTLAETNFQHTQSAELREPGGSTADVARSRSSSCSATSVKTGSTAVTRHRHDAWLLDTLQAFNTVHMQLAYVLNSFRLFFTRRNLPVLCEGQTEKTALFRSPASCHNTESLSGTTVQQSSGVCFDSLLQSNNISSVSSGV